MKVNPNNANPLKCDYLVVGAGASSLAFVDTLLTENPSAKVVVVDKKAVPGGHWVDDYDYVRLHQPSIVYGLASRALEGSWWRLMCCRFTLPWNHRATKEEILTHFERYIGDKAAAGQIDYYPCCEYDFSSRNGKNHTFHSLVGKGSYDVEVSTKLINGVLGENQIPSRCPVKFPVDERITLVTPNDLYHAEHAARYGGKHDPNGIAQTVLGDAKRYIVLGCGKTAMDAVVYLRSVMKVDARRITWVIPNDVWMIAREGGGNPGSLLDAILDCRGDQTKAVDSLEEKGILVRLDREHRPTRFRFPMIGKDELKLMREIKDLIRRGRVTSIDVSAGRVRMNFGPDEEGWTSSSRDFRDDVFVHCTSPGPFVEFDDERRVFQSNDELNLLLLYSPPISISMSCLGYLEARRTRKQLDLEFGRKLIRARDGVEETLGDNDVLLRLFSALETDAGKADVGTPRTEGAIGDDDASDFGTLAVRATLNLALFLALADVDPTVGHAWLRKNRLSFLSIPGFKCAIYETTKKLSEEEEGFLGLSAGDIRIFGMLASKLEVLKGK